MKKIFYVAALVLTMSVAVWSCKKDATPATNTTNTTLPDEQPAALADSLETLMNDPEMVEPSTTVDLVISSYPTFVETDYFALAIVEGPQGGTKEDSVNKSCLDGIKLTKDQKAKLLAAFNAKEDCMDANRKLLKELDRLLEAWIKEQKTKIMADAKAKMDSVNYMYNSGAITASQKKDMLYKIELERGALLKGLVAKAKEKVKSKIERLTAAGKIKDCEKTYMTSIKDILSIEQFEKWIKCHKELYKKK